MNLSDNSQSSVTTRLAHARLTQWHQQGEALLTIENARSFLNAAGLVLFAPRPQIAAPAPSFVEAVAGGPVTTPTAAQVAVARELLSRLVAEGLAVPLNLLGMGSLVGQPGDVPDFIASVQAFAYVFTLRGDKGWKQPPQSSGVAKVSNLAIAAHEALARRGALTAYDLTGELGKEVSESAVLRALGELWAHLRVLPLPQPDGQPTLWEPAGARLTKQIKAGANAGLPTALSALISLYLGQSIVASEDEIESFLSPLTARSRVRDVVHALIAARQLDTIAIEGRTVLHVAGVSPAFLEQEVVATPEAVKAADVSQKFTVGTEEKRADVKAEDGPGGMIVPLEPGSHIAKFVPRQRPAMRDLAKARPVKMPRPPVAEPRKSFGDKRPFAARDGKGKDSRPFSERRKFKRQASRSEEHPQRSERPRFTGEGDPQFAKKRFPARDGEFRPRFAKREEGRPAKRPYSRTERSGDDRPRRRFDSAPKGHPQGRPLDRSGERRPGGRPFGRPKPADRDRSDTRGENRPQREFRPKPFGRPKPFDRHYASGGEEKRGAGGTGGKRQFSRPGRPAGKPPRDRKGGGQERPQRGFAKEPRGSGFREKKFGGNKFGGAKFSGKKRPFGKPKSDRGPKPSPGEQEA